MRKDGSGRTVAEQLGRGQREKWQRDEGRAKGKMRGNTQRGKRQKVVLEHEWLNLCLG